MLCSAYISTGMSTVATFQLFENQNTVSHWEVWFQQREIKRSIPRQRQECWSVDKLLHMNYDLCTPCSCLCPLWLRAEFLLDLSLVRNGSHYALCTSRDNARCWKQEPVLMKHKQKSSTPGFPASQTCSKPMQGLTLRMSSRKAFLFPLNWVILGPSSSLLACTLSSLREDRHRANTASPLGMAGKRSSLESWASLFMSEILKHHRVSLSDEQCTQVK